MTLHVETLGPDAAKRELAARVEHHAGAPLALTLNKRRLGPYRGYAEMLSAVAELERRGATVEVIGRSVEEEPLFALTIGPVDAKRTTALVSGLHPMEWIGIETHLALLDQLVDRPPTDRRIVSIVTANPDGILKVERNLRRRRRRFVRHNLRGVDLNRNFPSYWGRFSLARVMMGKRIFAAGAVPASEPEVRSITAYFRGAMVDRALSFHSFGGVVLYPYGALLREPVDVAQHKGWARYVAERADPARPYRAVQSSRWVPGITAPGMELDWFHDEHGAISLLVECSRGGLSPRPGKVLEPFAWFNPSRPDRCAPSIAAAVEPFVRGMIRPGP